MNQNHHWNASLSTMWAMHNFAHLEDFFAAAWQLGFAQVELNHQIDSARLEGIDLQRVAISSIHEPCPADIPVEILKERDWLISAPDETNRRQGVRSIQRSIDMASSLGVKAIVVHCGNVHADWQAERELYDLFKAQKGDTGRFRALHTQLEEERNAQVGPRLEAVQKSLVELLAYASERGILLGLENRFHYMDIPDLEEMGLLLSLGSPDALGFWYDVGHAQTLDRLGYIEHEAWLKRYAGRMVGVHLHDAEGVYDHAAPGEGEVDFERLVGYIPPHAIHTLELRPKTTPEQVQKSLQFLGRLGCIRQSDHEHFNKNE